MFIDITGLFYYIKCIKSIHTDETRTDMCEKVCCKLACISAFCTGLRIKVASCIERRMPMILLDYKDRRPIYEQVVSKFEELMLLGAMKENEPLPSVRALAMDLSINPNTIQRAYVELERQGYIYTVKGKGSFVADNTVMKEKRKKEVLLQVSDMIDEAIRVGIPGDEIKNMVEIQYQAAKRNGGGEA